jgi:hypothetical protein
VLVGLAALCLGFSARANAYVYWANSGFNGGVQAIGRANLDGSGANQTFITDAKGACGVAVDANYVYWGNSSNGTIGRANLDGSGVNQSFINLGTGVCGVAVDSGHIYWGTGETGSTIGRANIDGSFPNPTFIPNASPTVDVCGVAVDGNYVYWAGGNPGKIGRAPLNTQVAEQMWIEVPTTNPCGVAVNATHVYWGNADGTVGRANIDGSSSANDLVTGTGSNVCGVAIRATNLYWSNSTALGPPPRTIGRSALDGSAANNIFITGTSGSCGVAVDTLSPTELPGNPPIGCNPYTQICDPTLIVCVGIWSGDCAGKLPKPNPVRVCVSLWEVCTGFGGRKPAGPGTIDMSGFPKSLRPAVRCGGTANVSSSNAREFAPNAGVARASGDGGAVANASDNASDRREMQCLIEIELQSKDPAAVKEARAKARYLLELAKYRSRVEEEKQSIIRSIFVIGDASSGTLPDALVTYLVSIADEAFDDAKKAGQTVKQNLRLDPTGLCTGVVTGEYFERCKVVFEQLQRKIEASLNQLSIEKQLNGLHQPFAAAKSSFALKGFSSVFARAGRGRRRVKPIAIGSGVGAVRLGRRGKVKIAIPRQARRLLKRARRHGARSIKAEVRVRSSAVTGITSVVRRRVRILLRRPGKRRHGPGRARGSGVPVVHGDSGPFSQNDE